MTHASASEEHVRMSGVADALPKTSTGKVHRARLRADAALGVADGAQ